ncbi:MAG TPA: (d)CMP kinase [Firmicutes bacterium]|nr:(d)CMP kinase [Bacillota bacterium]
MIAIAIDGPAGAGKSTIAKAVAQKLGYIYVDTGALYRTIALYMLENGISPSAVAPVEAALQNIRVELKFKDGEQKVFLNGKDVSEAIRKNEVSTAASQVSAIPAVRDFLFDLQRQLAEENHVIMDGRDIGTVVLPNADVKIYLTASPEERAARRRDQLLEKGEKVDYNQLLQEIRERDYNDSHRAIAPLKPAPDAIRIDTTDYTYAESEALILSIIEDKLS